MGFHEDFLKKVLPRIFEGATPDASNVALPTNIKSEVPAAFKDLLANPPKEKVVILAEYPPHFRHMASRGEREKPGNFPSQAAWWRDNIGKDFDVTIIPFYFDDIGHELKDVKNQLLGIEGNYTLAIMGHEGAELGGYPISELTKMKVATKKLGIRVGQDVEDRGGGVGRLMTEGTTSKSLRPGLGTVPSRLMGDMEPELRNIHLYQKWMTGDFKMPAHVKDYIQYDFPGGRRYDILGNSEHWKREAMDPESVDGSHLRNLHNRDLLTYKLSLHTIERNLREKPTISDLVKSVNRGQIKNILVGGCSVGPRRAEDMQDLSTSTGTNVFCQSGEAWGTDALKSIGKNPEDKFFVSGRKSGGMVFHPKTNPTMSEGRHKNPIFTWKAPPGPEDYYSRGVLKDRSSEGMYDRASWASRRQSHSLGTFSLTSFPEQVAKTKLFGQKHIPQTLQDYKQHPILKLSQDLFTPREVPLIPEGIPIMDDMIKATEDIDF